MRRSEWFLLTGAFALVVLLTLFVVRAASSAPQERSQIRPHPWPVMRVGLEVLVDGRPVATIQHRGKIYLPVPRLDTDYQIRVRNYGSRRITAVVSVDGLSVMNGQPASERHPGYIVAPYSSLVIDGWRRDNNTVEAFRFTDRFNSYAAKSGRPENIGVIGLVAFEEMSRWPRPLPMERGKMAARADRTGAAVGNTGTGKGHDMHSPIVEVPFVRSHNRRTVTIWYDTADALRRAGIPVERRYPEPFPGNRLTSR